ncbi:MAG: hypothetical protein OSA03_02970, partial [Nitrosopumilus sp.]|nr:hypothetical protein [Nitrosopumilus sp.]
IGITHGGTFFSMCVIPIEIAAGCPSFVPSGEATYILEVTSGFVEQYNITKDSILEIISI